MIDNEVLKKLLMVEKKTKMEARLLWIDLVLGDFKTTLSEIQHNYSSKAEWNKQPLSKVLDCTENKSSDFQRQQFACISLVLYTLKMKRITQ